MDIRGRIYCRIYSKAYAFKLSRKIGYLNIKSIKKKFDSLKIVAKEIDIFII